MGAMCAAMVKANGESGQYQRDRQAAENPLPVEPKAPVVRFVDITT